MANYQKALEKVLVSEGGYSNDPEDPGKETYCGISRRYHPHWEGWKLLDKYKENIQIRNNQRFKAMTISSMVSHFYLKYFWKPLRCQDIENQSIAESLFDHAVNCGKKPAVRLLQELCVAHGMLIIIDGICGPITARSVNDLSKFSEDFPNKFIKERIDDYFQKCNKHPYKYKWLKGWAIRSLRNLEK
jgi:lysozyme family protein